MKDSRQSSSSEGEHCPFAVGDSVLYHGSFNAIILSTSSGIDGLETLYSIKVLHSQEELHDVLHRSLRRVQIDLPSVKLEPEEQFPPIHYHPSGTSVKMESSNETLPSVKIESWLCDGGLSATKLETQAEGGETRTERSTDFTPETNLLPIKDDVEGTMVDERPSPSKPENNEQRMSRIDSKESAKAETCETYNTVTRCSTDSHEKDPSDGTGVTVKMEQPNPLGLEANSNDNESTSEADGNLYSVVGQPRVIEESQNSQQRTLQPDHGKLSGNVDERGVSRACNLETLCTRGSPVAESNGREIVAKVEPSSNGLHGDDESEMVAEVPLKLTSLENRERSSQISDGELEEGEVEERCTSGNQVRIIPTKRLDRQLGSGVGCERNYESQAPLDPNACMGELGEANVGLSRVLDSGRRHKALRGTVDDVSRPIKRSKLTVAPIDTRLTRDDDKDENKEQSNQNFFRYVLPSWAVDIHKFKDTLRNRVASRFPMGCHLHAETQKGHLIEVLVLELRIDGSDARGLKKTEVEKVLLRDVRQKLKGPVKYLLTLARKDIQGSYIPLNPNPEIRYQLTANFRTFAHMVVLEWPHKPTEDLSKWVKSTSNRERQSRSSIVMIEKGKFSDPKTTWTLIYVECQKEEGAKALKAKIQEQLQIEQCRIDKRRGGQKQRAWRRSQNGSSRFHRYRYR